jgi:hypothetical protein
MSERYTSGAASITVDDAALVRLLDRVSTGAASQFIDTTSGVLEGVKTGAVARWPVRTGRSRDGFNVRARAREDTLRVSLDNDATQRGRGYAWYVRYSVRTRDSLRAQLEEAVQRGKTPEAQAAIRAHMAPRILGKSGQRGAPSPELAGVNVWARFVRRPATKAKREIVVTLREQLARLARGGS